MTEPTTQDGFLGGTLRISQPKDGFRSGHDAVLLAACIDPTMPVEKLCELGSGVGVVSLCAAARLPQLDVTGIEIDPVQVALARDNAAQNGLAERVRFIAGDLTAPFDTLGLTANGFDMVLANPPYYRAGTVPEPDNQAKARAHLAAAQSLDIWVSRACALAKAGAYIAFIQRADALPELLAAFTPRLGDIVILPIAPRAGAAAHRIILCGRRDRRGAPTLLPPLYLQNEQGEPSAAAENILRHGAALAFAPVGG